MVCFIVLASPPNMYLQSEKRTKLDKSLESFRKRAKKSNSSLSTDYTNLKRENEDLKKQIHVFKTQWMPRYFLYFFTMMYGYIFPFNRPTGDALSYFIESYKILSHGSNNTQEDDKKEGKKFKELCNILNASEQDLMACRDRTSVTRACR